MWIHILNFNFCRLKGQIGKLWIQNASFGDFYRSDSFPCKYDILKTSR